MEELTRFQGSTFDTISKRYFQDAESVHSGQSHVTNQPVFFPPHPDPGGGMLSRSLGMPSRNDKLVNPQASLSSPYPQGFNPWISKVSEHTSPHVTSEPQNPDTTLDPRCQTGPSAANSFDPKEGRFSKDYGADQRRLQISELHFDKFPTPATFACWKTRFKTEVWTCSQFPRKQCYGSKKWRWLNQWVILNLRAL